MWFIVLLLVGALTVEGRPPDQDLPSRDYLHSMSAGATVPSQFKRPPRNTGTITCDQLKNEDPNDQILTQCKESEEIGGSRTTPITTNKEDFFFKKKTISVPILFKNSDLPTFNPGYLETIAQDFSVTDNSKMTFINFGILHTSIPGHFIVTNNPILKNINLLALKDAGDLTIKDNPEVDVINLISLETAGDMTIENNPKVTNIKLSPLKTAGVMTIKNTQVTDITLPALDTAGGMTIENNPSLKVIKADKLALFGPSSKLIFSNNDKLETISLHDLLRGFFEVRMQHNKKLKTVDLQGYQEGKVVISNNPSLEEIIFSTSAAIRFNNVKVFGNRNMNKAILDNVRGRCDNGCYIQPEKECIFSSPLTDLSKLDDCLGIYGDLIIDPAVTGATTTKIKYITGNLQVVDSTTLNKEGLEKFLQGVNVTGTIKLSNNILMCGVKAADLQAIFHSVGGQKTIEYLECITTQPTTMPTTVTQAETTHETTLADDTTTFDDQHGQGNQDDEEDYEDLRYEVCGGVPPSFVPTVVIWYMCLIALAVGSHFWANRCEERLELRSDMVEEIFHKGEKPEPPRGARYFGFPLSQDMCFEYIPMQRVIMKDPYHSNLVGRMIKFAKDLKFDIGPLIKKHHWHRAVYHEYCHPAIDMEEMKDTEKFSIAPSAVFLADHNRVKLNKKRWRMTSDFFNASFLRYPKEKMPALKKHPHANLYNDEIIWLDDIGNRPRSEEKLKVKREAFMSLEQYKDFELIYMKETGAKPRKFDGVIVNEEEIQPKSVTPPEPSPTKQGEPGSLEPIDKKTNDKTNANTEERKTAGAYYYENLALAEEFKRIKKIKEKMKNKGPDYKKYCYPDEVPGLLRRDRDPEYIYPHLRDIKNLRKFDEDRIWVECEDKTNLEYPMFCTGHRILERRVDQKERRKEWIGLPDPRPLYTKKRRHVKKPLWRKQKKNKKNKKDKPVRKENVFRRVMHNRNLKKNKAKRMRQKRFQKNKRGYGCHGDKAAEKVKSWPAKGLHDKRMDEYAEKLKTWLADKNKKTQRNMPLKETYVPALFAVREMDVANAWEGINHRRHRRRRNPTLLNKMRLRLVRLRRRLKQRATDEDIRMELQEHPYFRAFERGTLGKRMGTRRKKNNKQSPFPDQLMMLKKRLQDLQEKKRSNHLANVYRQRKKLNAPGELYRRETKYICSQHPQLGQEYAFWSMVVDHHVKSVVAFGHESDTLTGIPQQAIYSPINHTRGGPRRRRGQRKIHVDVERRGWLPPENIPGKEPEFEQYHNESCDHRPPQGVMDHLVGFVEVKGEDPYTKEKFVYLQSELKQCVLVTQLTVHVPALFIRRTVYHFQYYNWETQQRPRMTVFMNVLGAVGKIGGSVLAHDVEGYSQAPCFLGAAMLLQQIRKREPITDFFQLLRQMRQDRLGCLTRTKYFLIIIRAVFHFVFNRYRIFYRVHRAPYMKKVRAFMKKMKEETKEKSKQ